MGIFNSKHDDAQTITPNTDAVAADTTSVATSVDSTQAVAADTSTAPTSAPVDTTTTTDSATDGFLTTNEPTSAPEVEANETATGAPEVPSSTETTVTATPETTPVVETVSEEPTATTPETSILSSAPSVSPIDVKDASDSEDLSDIKEEALKQLSPLISKLDQTPEEKFHTAMMMVQSTDDKSLIKTAYEAAQAITDDKDKAQALLDIVNEINYFTQQNSSEVN